MLAAIDGGTVLRATVAKLRRDQPELVSTASVEVGDLLFVAPDRADLLFEVSAGGGDRTTRW
ncbi:hypothetical protein [Parafrankia sp. FMc2]|uniref:hypothetical protein n=1 Tax=Parafrankia sp. FMc2 TaxID=3233196 RepID=UPI0034D6AECE